MHRIADVVWPLLIKQTCQQTQREEPILHACIHEAMLLLSVRGRNIGSHRTR